MWVNEGILNSIIVQQLHHIHLDLQAPNQSISYSWGDRYIAKSLTITQ